VLELIEGPTAIAFLEADGDPAAVAKVLNDTARAHDVLVIRGGVLEGNLVGDAEIKRLATLPPVDVLRAQLVGAVAAPLTTVVGLFTAPLRDLVGVLDARIRQLEEQGETVPEPEAEAAAEEPQAEAAPEEPTAEEPTAEEPTAEEEQSEEPSAEAEVASADEEEEAQDG
jgi:large subunit ribosomal protein L10